MRTALNIAPGLVGDDSSFAASGRWADGSNVRFRLGKPQPIGGWESLVTTLLTGVCRKALPWTDNAGQLNVGFGAHSNLQVYYGGALYDITPTLQYPPTLLASNPLATTNASTTVTVTHTAHGRTTGDSVAFSGAAGFNNVTVTGAYAITVIDANSYTIVAGTTANATGAGGGSAVVAAPQAAFQTGAIDGTGASGFGTGTYGAGAYGLPSTADWFPRTWSFGAWGQNLLGCPRGAALHQWSNNTGARAQPVQNSPANITYALVAPNGGGYQAFALGCSQEADGVFNPMAVRHCSVRKLTEWNTSNLTTAREYVLTGGGRIVAGAVCGAYLLIWTDDSLFLGQWVGQLAQPWRFDRVARNCGLIGPGAFAVKGLTAYWMSPDKQFYTYQPGGKPLPIPCEIRDDFAANLAPSQGDKIVAATNSAFGEVWWFYPDTRDGYENSRYLALNVDGAAEDIGKWFRGQLARTAACDAGPLAYPLGVTFPGNVYSHEKGKSADGGSWTAYIKSADLYVDENRVMALQSLWPDLTEQACAVSVTAGARFYPQDSEATTGALPMAPGAQKVDFRLSGRLLRVTLSSTANANFWRLGKLDVDLTPGGMR